MDRFHSIDSMKCIAIFLVVFFHIVTYGANGNENINLWLLVFPRFVLPYFFLVSGFLFDQKIKSVINPVIYFKKYIFNLIKLFLGWYFIYLIYDIFIRIIIAVAIGNKVKAELISFFKSLPTISVIYYGVGNTAYHLWYLTALIWSIVILFLFLEYKKLHLLLFISFILNMVGLFGQTYSGIFYIPINTRDALFFGLFYVTLGCFFSFHIERIRQLNSRVKSKTLFTFFLLSCIFQMIESLVTVKWLNGTKGGIGYYVSTIPLSISLFMLILKNKGFGNQSILSRIGKNSLGIYVSHMLFISFSIWVIRFFNLQRLIGNIGFILFLTVFVFVFSHYFYIFTQSLKGRFNNWILIKIQSILLLPRIKSNQDKVKNQMVNKN